MQNNNGFTLIELLITIVILTIIAMIATPSFQNLIEKNKLDSKAREVSFLLSDARAQASTLRQNITIKFQQGVNSPTTLYWTPNSDTIKFLDETDDVDFSDVIYTPVGMPKQRTKLINNPICVSKQDAENPCKLDPGNNPLQVHVIVPLKFALCNSKIGQSRIVKVSLNGSIEKIESGVCKNDQ